MKILVIGAAGKMGRAVSWYLGQDQEVTKVGLLDAHEAALKTMAKEGNKYQVHAVSIEDTEKLQGVMKQYDAGVVVMPNRNLSYKAIEAAIAIRMNLVDILEEAGLTRLAIHTNKALELPGLWNGSMADWITLCVEIPIITFNPVKTVEDLLRPEHQPDS